MKIFGIGAPRTGTTSLGRAFSILGLNQKGWDPVLQEHYENRNLGIIYETVPQFDAFQDGPWNMEHFYQLLDKAFPSSKFILTIRDVASWSISHEHWFSRDKKPKIEEKYWIDNYDKNAEAQKYLARNQEAINYFKDTDKLLVLNIVGGEGWSRLCPFLGKPIPNKDFPWRNRLCS